MTTAYNRLRMPIRRARPTLRCLEQDLHIGVPPLSQLLDDLANPWMVELRRVAPSSPKGQKRILSIDEPLVFRLRISSGRGATWVDEPVVWLCGVHGRQEDSDDDAFNYFQGLHAAGNLLPTEPDRLRLRAEDVLILANELTEALVSIIDRAISAPDVELAVDLCEWMPCRVLVRESRGLQEVWCGLRVLSVDDEYIDEKLRNVLFIRMEEHLAPIAMEAREDWASGDPVPWFETVRYGVR
jgi:hypothetical protein